MRISELEGRRVALWGFGREGRAAHRSLRRRLPSLPLTLFCSESEKLLAAGLDDSLLSLVALSGSEQDLKQMRLFDVLIKSPGISRYRSPAPQLESAGVHLTSGTALWFAEALPGLKIAVTGTKGKSTTTALIAHLIRGRGMAVGLVGNIGLPLLDVLDPPLMPAVWAIELSSYQVADATQPDVAVVLNLFPEHLDWHGSEARYFEDKLALVRSGRPGTAVLNWNDPRLREVGESLDNVQWFGREDGWHLRGGELYQGENRRLDRLPPCLPGRHNGDNLCAALTAIDATGIASAPLLGALPRYRALPHRLQTLGTREGINYIDDSIATTPHASLAALDCLGGRRVAIIVGGFERGVDWSVFAGRMLESPPAAVICVGQNGPRIEQLLAGAESTSPGWLHSAPDIPEAVALAQREVGIDGVVLLSPGAPSFPTYRDYAERGRHFAEIAGFSPDLSDISALGIR